MRTDKRPVKMQTSISKHAYFDLSHVSPLVFLYLLKGCYAYGTCRASVKFRALQQQVHLVLLNNAHAGPTNFIARCLCLLPMFESYYDGLCHLVISALRRYLKGCNDDEDVVRAKICAAKLFVDFVVGSTAHDEALAIKIVQTFDVKLMHIETAMCIEYEKGNSEAESAKELVEQYITKLIETGSYMNAVDLLIQFSIPQSEELFLLKMMECREFKAAEKWAMFTGKPMLCLLVKEYVKLNLAPFAYEIIKKNNLRQEFPELYHQSKECALKKFAEKGVWDVAEARANGDRKLLEYLIYLAVEAGYTEKVEELCDRYSFKGFLNFKDTEENSTRNRYLQLHELFIDDVVWVDEVDNLHDATSYLVECKVIGMDCEWKPIYEKGRRPSKVSIMQVASEKKVYIFDLIKLYEDVPAVLDDCLSRIMHSSSILKLGYNFQCDVKQLASSYGELNCFKHFEMLLDIQNVFKEHRGGLSGLTEKILGTGLNKTRRSSNWEQRPLSQNQLEYAALDAAVLLHIFRHVGHTQSDGEAKSEWKSHIVSHMDSTEMPKKDTKTDARKTHVPSRRTP